MPTLISVLTALGSSNPKLNVAIVDDNDLPLITFNAEGYASVESDLGANEVKRITVNSATLLTIAIDSST